MDDVFETAKKLVRDHASIMQFAVLPKELARLDDAVLQGLIEEREGVANRGH